MKIKIAIIALIGLNLGIKAQWNTNGNNSTTGILTMDGNSINFNTPITSGGWARGSFNVASDKTTRFGGVGLYGIGNTSTHYYIAHGTSPWISGLGLYIKTNGNVGIGTHLPNATLQIGDSQETGSPSSEIEIKRLSLAPVTHGGSDWFFTTRDNNPNANMDIGYGNNKALTLRHDGNIGIGATNPREKLEVDGSIIIKDGHNLSWGNKYGAGIPTIAANTTSGIHFYPNGSTLGATMKIFKDGKTQFTNNITVLGKIESKEIKVTNTPTADFVFEENYNLPTLTEIEKYIKEKKHLPEIASAEEMEKNGVNIGDFQIQLLQKIEELTLYTIAQEKQLKVQEKKIKTLEEQTKEIKELKALVQKLIKDK
ncbi:exported hypothetical protein [Tenacibaculum sediminilitoris]|uniref:hypothetical protein n=1 Tax=Tenacibaculum sediminilitoris TaxID=1820334 RepID=UPI003892E905